MISADLHLHTSFSHGASTPSEMFQSARQACLAIMGFSEHSPRPAGYNYTHEYRAHLTASFPDYIAQVRELKQHKTDNAPKVLLGLEMDWLPAEEEFVRQSIAAYDYDYLIGSVHFINHWGFDDTREPWQNATQEECEQRYNAYFQAWRSMLSSGLFQIAAHPDLIKIYSVGQFHIWLDKSESRDLVRSCLLALRNANMAMEISSAGLRKACGEIYPCPLIMSMAAELGLMISFASDAHNTADVAYGFESLAAYARSFGFRNHVVFEQNHISSLQF